MNQIALLRETVYNKVWRKTLLALIALFYLTYFFLDFGHVQSDKHFKHKRAAASSLGNLKGVDEDASSEYREQNEFINLAPIRNANLIFVGGHGRSGTTLMRAILDVHSQIRCGPESKIVRLFLDSFKGNMAIDNIWQDLQEAGVKNQTINDAVASFVYHVMANHGPKAPRLCMKDPHTLVHIGYLHQLFPNAKFVYMIRDGRAAVYSTLLYSKIQVNSTIFKAQLELWSTLNKQMDQQCRVVGPDFCMRIKYEDLVMETNRTMREVVKFLNETWEEQLLEHQKFIGSEIAVSKIEWSTDQIKKPINKDSLTSWLSKIPSLTEHEIRQAAPMIETFGYNLTANLTDNTEKPKEVTQHSSKLFTAPKSQVLVPN